MKISIQGHSGCDIEIINKDNNLYVRKSTKDIGYFKRLLLQAEKQKTDTCTNKNILNPKIHEVIQNDDEVYMLMDYIYANNFIDFFEHASYSQIDNFIDTFIKYINDECEKCSITEVNKSVFIDKFASVEKNCHKNELLKNNNIVEDILIKSKQKFNSLPESIKLPIGKCHGDLTFSNILFSSENIYFIDYLDSFIETPIQDIVKLRQDTKYFWSVMMYHDKYDIVRLNMIFKYIDNKIDNYFINDQYYKEIYNTLQLMNILRILPYVKNIQIRDFVLNILISLV
jgi:serine/threonine protein kinase